jgi:hypothetical protein
MAVEVNDAHRTVVTVDGAEEGKGDGVVTSKSDQTRQCLALLRRTRLVGMGVRCAAQKEVVAFFDLLERIRVVIRSDWDVSTINDLSPRIERVRLQWDIVSAIEIEAARTLSDTAGAEASTWAV